ncbi:protein CPR-5 [Neltuma alba]|uniref:protein CPR-5 n=1 Tax=Neltuma alba TaxID=207710 RepID=UPI0010A46C91|nr:protein CPR-5-like [Prosopis alba]
MEAVPSSSSQQPQHCNNCLSDSEHDTDHRDGEAIVMADSNNGCSHPMVQRYPPRPIDSELKRSTRCKKRTLMKKRVALDNSESPSSSSSRYSSSAVSSQRGITVACQRRSPKVRVRRSRGDVATIGFPLGMSFAAVIAQMLYRRDKAAERMSPEHLSLMCTSAVRESLANVFGDKLDGLTRNFEQSFDSTLNTLRLIYESTTGKKGSEFDTLRREVLTSELTLDKGGCKGDAVEENACSEAVMRLGIQDQSNSSEEVKESIPMDSASHSLIVPGQLNPVARLPPFSARSIINNSDISLLEKSVMEQSLSNDLKMMELGLQMEKLGLQKKNLDLKSDSNNLERSKLAMGISKQSFKEEKFKNEQEDLRHGELSKKCIDCLIAGLLVMSSSLLYGAYVYSYERIAEATASCAPLTEEGYSWWTPRSVSSFNSRMNVLLCQVQVVSRMTFGFLMICAVAYLLMWRSTASTTQTMPVTFILLLLGVACGYFGKLCVDTLGGNGYVWLLYWEILCLLHFLSIVCTSVLFQILHEPVTATQTRKGDTKFPYWFRRFLFYASLLVFLPLFCGLLPFAGLVHWKDHFMMKLTEHLTDSS